MTRLRLLLAAMVACVAVPVHAGGYCGQSFSTYRQTYAAPIVQTFYFVGQPLRAAAIVEAEKRADPDYAAFLSFKQFRGEFQAFQQFQQQAAEQQQPAALAQQAPPSFIASSCVRCHSGSEPRGGLDLTHPAFTADELKAITARVVRGEMPPAESAEGKAFTGDAGAGVLVEAVGRLAGEKVEAGPTAEIPAGAMP